MKTREYVIRAGDTLSDLGQIVQMHWRELYALPENAAFRALRTDPNFIKEGDVLVIPDRSLDILRHALGIESYCCWKSRVPKGLGATSKYGRRWRKPRRNQYTSEIFDLECQHLVSRGFMTGVFLNTSQWCSSAVFKVTDLGQEEALKGIVYKRKWGYDT